MYVYIYIYIYMYIHTKTHTSRERGPETMEQGFGARKTLSVRRNSKK